MRTLLESLGTRAIDLPTGTIVWGAFSHDRLFQLAFGLHAISRIVWRSSQNRLDILWRRRAAGPSWTASPTVYYHLGSFESDEGFLSFTERSGIRDYFGHWAHIGHPGAQADGLDGLCGVRAFGRTFICGTDPLSGFICELADTVGDHAVLQSAMLQGVVSLVLHLAQPKKRAKPTHEYVTQRVAQLRSALASSGDQLSEESVDWERLVECVEESELRFGGIDMV